MTKSFLNYKNNLEKLQLETNIKDLIMLLWKLFKENKLNIQLLFF